ncbi:pentapeptide repeat-containing protein [Burkholderia cepacia]|uniref:pentapeptide repeat-containing protein n=1 Tax=Burkholderia cepacia TaxID=292 RepID=UPI003C7E7D42
MQLSGLPTAFSPPVRRLSNAPQRTTFQLVRVHLSSGRFSRCRLSRCRLSRCRLSRCRLSRCRLSRCRLSRCRLSRCRRIRDSCKHLM